MRSKGDRAGQMKRWRARRKAAGNPIRNKHDLRRDLPFIGVDTEGAGKDSKGRQRLLLLRAGERELFHNNRVLTTRESLQWLLQLKPEFYYVGFGWNYDASMILHDMPHEYRRRFFMSNAEKMKEFGFVFRYVHWERYAIDYQPHGYLRVARLAGNKRIPGSERTICDTYTNFAGSFLTTLQQYGIGREHWATIKAQKERRAAFKSITPAIRGYNRVECQLLAELMERYRGDAYRAGIFPRSWDGRGKLAAALHTANQTLKRKELPDLLPAGLLEMAPFAYFSGRHETARQGDVPGPVWHHDQRSAYPAKMLELPCLVHGTWHKTKAGELARHLNAYAIRGTRPPLFVAPASYHHPAGNLWCGLPQRTKSGVLTWPRMGKGVFWSPEMASAIDLGATLELEGGWQYEKRCDCCPFEWVRPLYQARLATTDPGSDQALKGALAALSGHLAARGEEDEEGERTGGTWLNYVWAGLTTALVRADLNRAIARNPEAVILLAADAIYSSQPLDLEEGEELGQWRFTKHDDGMFICAPGVYWGRNVAAKRKTRGLPLRMLEPHIPTIEKAWRKWTSICQLTQMAWEPPVISVPVEVFISIREANARNQPDLACRWFKDTKALPLLLKPKRIASRFDSTQLFSRPPDGSKQAKCWRFDEITEESLSDAESRLHEATPGGWESSNIGFHTGEDEGTIPGLRQHADPGSTVATAKATG